MGNLLSNVQTEKTALVVEGGAVRCLFSNGVLDGFLKHGFKPFDLYIGVSAGATNIAAFLAEAPERNLRIYTEYARRPEFINIWRFLRGGHLIDLNWLWETTINEIPLDTSRIVNNSANYLVVATDIERGCPVYLRGNHPNILQMLLASSALPLLYRNFPIVEGRLMTDGGLADALPVEKAIAMGATRILVLRSRPKDYIKTTGLADHYIGRKYAEYPHIKSLLKSRATRYNESLSLIRKPPNGVKITEVCMPENLRLSRFTQSNKQVLNAYMRGFCMSPSIIERWQADSA